LYRLLAPGNRVFGSARQQRGACRILDPAVHVRWLFETIGSKQRVRAVFSSCGSSYNLSLTDPTVEEQLKSLPNGLHASSSIDLYDDRLAFCISLGEAFSDGNCRKLVAGVTELPLMAANMSVAATPPNAGKSKSVLQALRTFTDRGRINESRSKTWNRRTGSANAFDDDARAVIG
jgi:hypothetical protein